jgi:hypothetical protein
MIVAMLVTASLSECYQWFIQSLGESKNITCSFKDLVSNDELSYLTWSRHL